MTSDPFRETLIEGHPLVFTGRVLPERANVNIRLPRVGVEMVFSRRSVEAQIQLSIGASQVSVAVAIPDADPPDVWTLKNMVETFVRTATDALGYVSGCGYDCEISAVTAPNGEHSVFGVNVPGLEETSSERPFSAADTLELAMMHPLLARALSELREAIREPSHTAARAWAAIESIRQAFVDQDDEGKSQGSWTRMREELKIERGFFSPLEPPAKAQRHGEFFFMNAEERGDAMLRAVRVVDRYSIYLRNGHVDMEVLQ